MKRIFNTFILLILFLLVYNFREEIFVFYASYCLPIEKKVSVLSPNAYYRDYDFDYVKNTNNFIPNNKEEIKNIYYTIVNSGMDNFTFYCPSEYETCVSDVNEIANDQTTISNINNFVHPYNSFKSLKTEVESSGKVYVEIEKVYTNEMIILIDYKINEIYKEIIKYNDTETNKIKTIHDYIINNTKYDKERSDNKIINYKSDNAYGVLIENYGLCGGYTDAMMLFLEKIGVKSIKVSTDNHIWNYVNIDNKWLHLDLTWDDPISSDGKDILDDTFFLITDKELIEIEKTEHNYDISVYKN